MKKSRLTEQIKQINWKDKNTWLVIGLIGALILVVAMPTGGKLQMHKDSVSGRMWTEHTDEENTLQEQADCSVGQMELRLQKILSKIDGVGAVRVMITQKDYGQQIVENHSFGEKPFVSRELTPQIEGVLVVAQGGANSAVKQNILQAVKSLFPLDAHKITVVKMSMQEDRLP